MLSGSHRNVSSQTQLASSQIISYCPIVTKIIDTDGQGTVLKHSMRPETSNLLHIRLNARHIPVPCHTTPVPLPPTTSPPTMPHPLHHTSFPTMSPHLPLLLLISHCPSSLPTMPYPSHTSPTHRLPFYLLANETLTIKLIKHALTLSNTAK